MDRTDFHDKELSMNKQLEKSFSQKTKTLKKLLECEFISKEQYDRTLRRMIEQFAIDWKERERTQKKPRFRYHAMLDKEGNCIGCKIQVLRDEEDVPSLFK